MQHIPSMTTSEISVLQFEDALRGSCSGSSAGEDECGYDREKWIYVPDFYSEYRYILGTRGDRSLIAIGINPSTAAPGALDNTLKSVERIALSNGYDSFIMFNVSPQRATNPDLMDIALNPALHRENMKAFEYVLASCGDVPAVWAAWGTMILKRQYLTGCVRDMIAIGERYSARWYTCGARSKNGGHPHHPLYLKKNLPLDEFDVGAYLGSLGQN